VGLESIPQSTRDEFAGAMYRNAITELLDPLQPGTATTGRRLAALPEPEAISPTPEAGTLDNILNWASIIASGLSGARGTTPPPAQTPTSTSSPPPAAVPPYRSPDTTTTTSTRQPNYFGDVVQTPRSTALLAPGAGSPSFDPTAPTSLNAGLTGLTGSGLPSIASLVPSVPRPTAPLSPYDPYGRRRPALPDLYGNV
jgi:hypothetical protein